MAEGMRTKLGEACLLAQGLFLGPGWISNWLVGSCASRREIAV
jgi:hypothetical protein